MITEDEFNERYGDLLSLDDLPLDAIVPDDDGTTYIIEELIPFI